MAIVLKKTTINEQLRVYLWSNGDITINDGRARVDFSLEQYHAIHAAIHADDEPAVAEKATCGSCEYFIGNMCRRYPPVSVYSPPYGDDPLPWSPAVFEDEWCGEHRPANRANPVDRGVKWPEEVE